MNKLLLILTMTLALTLLPNQATAQTPADIAEGAKVWANQCTRCHNARSPMERSDRQWATIIAHMRARANLTRSEANQVRAYLQAINAPETTHVLSSQVRIERHSKVSPQYLGQRFALRKENVHAWFDN